MTTISLIREMKDVVECVQEAQLERLKTIDANIKAVTYYHGTFLDMADFVQGRSKNATTYDTFPMIALIEPFPIVQGSSDTPVATVNMIIAMHSKVEYKSYQRQAVSFEPILIPLYEQLLIELSRRQNIIALNTAQDLPHTRTDHKVPIKFNTIVDWLAIDKLQLKLKRTI